jgi:hypothetical protein
LAIIDLEHHSPAAQLTIPLVASSRSGAVRHNEPVTLGLPVGRGVLKPGTLLGLRQGERVTPVQAVALDAWPDGSVRWLLVDAQIDQPARNLELVAAPEGRLSAPQITLKDAAGALSVSTGPLEATLTDGDAFPLHSVRSSDGTTWVSPGGAAFNLVGSDERSWKARWDQPSIEVDGPLRSVITVPGTARAGAARLQLELQLTFYAGSPAIAFRMRLRNPSAAQHPGGKWDLGDPASILLKEASIRVTVASTVARAVVQPAPDAPSIEGTPDLAIFQASSGGENWNSSNHVDRNHRVPLEFRGYRIDAADTLKGLRATPLVTARTGIGTISAAAHLFWQVFPKAIEIKANTLVVSQFPRQCVEPQELQPGEQSTWEFAMAFGEESVSRVPLEWVIQPSVVRATPEYYASTDSVTHLTPESRDPHAAYLALVHQAVEGPSAFHLKRETIDEYGWRDFGDVYGDHEAVFEKGPTPLVSHWNNQYDAVYGGLVHWMRTGDPRWMQLGLELASHVVDIDVYHTDADKSTYNGGLFWHTCHYVDADTATHRTYPFRRKVSGGGPSGGHLYTTGLLHAYYLTGEKRYRDAVVGLAEYVITCDDGSRTPFRWLDSGATGHATLSAGATYHGPGRAGANALNAVIDGHRLTGDERFLRKAFEIVHRCIHPDDDVPARNLLDAENRWFYTMFLQSLGKLLDHLAIDGRIDDQYYYARESLLAYARWMADHERPYLDHAEQLEYPTETWAAQDMRKCEVFQSAAKHATDGERARLFERATFFFDYSVKALASFATRGLCRPTVLMMVNGWSRAWFLENLAALPLPSPPPAISFGKPVPFVSQKIRAIRNLKRLLVAGGALVAIAAAVALLIFMR